MAQKAIREYDAKLLMKKVWQDYFDGELEFFLKSVLVSDGKELEKKAKQESWLKELSLVAKPDMLFGKRGKNGLVYVNKNLEESSEWVDQKSSEQTTLISGETGVLNKFLVEPFVKHDQSEEFYISASTEKEYDVLYLSLEGGIEVEENWDKVTEIQIPLGATDEDIEKLVSVAGYPENFLKFARGFYKLFRDLHFAYLEINPIVLSGDNAYILDSVARVDDTAHFWMRDVWGELEFPSAFGGQDKSEEEKYIESLDEKTGASLKLTILNPEGRVWPMVAGGGGSVVYSDTIADVFGANHLACYGEYSGNPSTEETKLYAKTVLNLLIKNYKDDGKPRYFLIGGAIANFTDVAKTFTGIIQALEEKAEELKKLNVKIYVRRGGPNYELGLKNIKEAADRLGLEMQAFGPEVNITSIVNLAFENEK